MSLATPGSRTAGGAGRAAGFRVILSAVLAVAASTGLAPGAARDPASPFRCPAAGSEWTATGSEILRLDEEDRLAIRRCLYRGGRLTLVGQAVQPALALLAPDALTGAGSIHSVGLGQVRTVAMAPEERAAGEAVCELFGPAENLAATRLRPRREIRAGLAVRTFGYLLLLLTVLPFTRGRARGWREAGLLSLVLVIASWPLWGRTAAVQDWAQVDVLLDAPRAPLLLWSASVLRSGGRQRVEMDPGPSSWALEVREEDAHQGASGPSPEGSVSRVVPLGGGLRIGWLGEETTEKRLALQVGARGDRIVGLVRNGFDRTWEDAWLLLPGREPLRLGELPALAPLLVDGPLPQRGAGRRVAHGELPRERARLIEEALDCLASPLLSRDEPVIVAWSRSPFRPARLHAGSPVDKGWTLLVAGGREDT